MSIDTDLLASRTIEILKKSAISAWDSWSSIERQVVLDCAQDAARVTILAMTDPEKAKKQKPFVDAALANIKVAGSASAATLIWDILAKVLEMAISILIGVIL